MTTLLRTDSANPDFIALVQLLDLELADRDGADRDFYHQFNKIDHIRHVVLAVENGRSVGCGSFKEFAPETLEIKRMYTLPDARGRGVAAQVLTELEAWAAELSYKKCVLETGINQPEAIALYRKCAYQQIPNYGQYAGKESSLCFEKSIG